MPFNLVIVIAPKIAFIDIDGNICLYKTGAVAPASSFLANSSAVHDVAVPPVRPRSTDSSISNSASVTGVSVAANENAVGTQIAAVKDKSENNIDTTAFTPDNMEYLNSTLVFNSGVQIVEEVIVKQHLVEVLQNLFDEEYICTKATIFDDVSDNSIQAMFICNEGENADMVITRLAHVGIGSLVGSVNVVSLETSKFYKQPPPAPIAAPEEKETTLLLNPNTKTESTKLEEEEREAKLEEEKQEAIQRKQFLAAASRIRVEQIIETIEAGAVMRLDYLALLIVSSTIAGIGLATNNTVAIVASMLVSPIMGPVLALTFGTVINDQDLMLLGLRTELISLSICIVIGFVLGAFSILIGTDGLWPTPEMIGRGLTDALAIGLGIAIPSGVGVALSVLGNNTASLVGVAISASLLPPAVNCGICFAYAAFGFQADSGAVDDQQLYSTPGSYIDLGGISLALTMVNIGAIYIAAMAMFKIKEVAPLDQKAAFWQKDIGAFRNSNGGANRHSVRLGSSSNTNSQDQSMDMEAGGIGVRVQAADSLGLHLNPFTDPSGAFAQELFDMRNNHHLSRSSDWLSPYNSPSVKVTPNRHSASFAESVLDDSLLGELGNLPMSTCGVVKNNRFSLPVNRSKPPETPRAERSQAEVIAELQGIKQRFRKKAVAKKFGKKVETC